MRVKICSHFVLAVMLMVILVSCGGSSETAMEKVEEAPKDNGIDSTLVQFSMKSARTYYLCEADTTFGTGTTIYTTSSVKIQWPEKIGESDLKSLQDSLMSSALGTVRKPINQAIADYVKKPQYPTGDTQLKEVKSLPQETDDVRVLANEVEANVLSFNEKYLVYKIYCFDDLGGAHPVFANYFINYDVLLGKVLTFDDIFTKGNDELILDVIKATLCDMYLASTSEELENNSGIRMEDVNVTRNIFIRDKSIVFYYNPYEIAPWAVGAVEVAIPEYNLDQFMTDEAKSLFE